MVIAINPKGIRVIWFNNDIGLICIDPIARVGEIRVGVDVAGGPIKNAAVFDIDIIWAVLNVAEVQQNTTTFFQSQFRTALGVIATAHNQGKKIQVYATETRPLLQGARLTMWELGKLGALSASALPSLRGCLGDEKTYVRKAAATAIKNIKDAIEKRP